MKSLKGGQKVAKSITQLFPARPGLPVGPLAASAVRPFALQPLRHPAKSPELLHLFQNSHLIPRPPRPPLPPDRERGLEPSSFQISIDLFQDLIACLDAADMQC